MMVIKFKSPSVDTCKNCDLLKAKIDVSKTDSEERTTLIQEQQIHHLEADLAYKSKDRDKLRSKNDASIKTYTFDLQQCLPTPYLQNSLSFYKRQLWTYNLTVHDCATNDPFCYMWHEAAGGRGGNNIASCLFKHLKSLPSDVQSVVFYSDCCPGQNKNSYVVSMFTTFMENNSNIKCIDHKFLIPGHTHMECDSDHAIIEKKKKITTTKIHHPRDWYTFVGSVGGKRTFNVVEMNDSDFYAFGNLIKTKFQWRHIAEKSEKFSWKNVKWLRYSQGDFGVVQFKNSLNDDEPFKRLNIRRRGFQTVTYSDLEKDKYPQTITPEKKKDLLDLLQFIDPCFHEFYKNIKTTIASNIHPDLVEEDDELEA